MSDKLENFIKNNREKFDQQIPETDVWNNINAGLAQQAAAGGSAAATAATKSGLAQLSTAWKLAATAIATIAVGTVIYFAAAGGGSDQPPATGNELAATAGENDPDRQVEFVQTASPLVNPPLPDADIAYYDFNVNGKKGGAWTAPSGTVVTVGKNTFVDADGQLIKGDVDIKYREFHDAADIILSGIPMTYDDNGKLENFQTAGMMEIQGYQDGKPVFIADGKSISISSGSFVEGDDYKLWALDPEQRAWIDQGMAEIGPNTAKRNGLKQLPKVPKEPQAPSKGTPGVEMDNELAFTVDYQEYPELKPFKKVRWEAADEKFMKKNQWVFTKTWNEVQLRELDSETMEYEIMLKNSSRQFAIKVKPVLEGKDYEKAMAKFRKKMDKFEKLKVQAAGERARLQAQADVYRSFDISGFGIYNHDRFVAIGNLTVNNAKLEFPEGIYVKGNQTKVYQIIGNDRAVVVHDDITIGKLRFSPRERTFLVTILPGNKIGVFYPKDFDAIDLEEAKSPEEYPIRMQVIDKDIRNADDLRSILNV